MKDNDDINYGEVNITSLVECYERMCQSRQSYYFDVEDFESIVSYYLYDSDVEKARKAIDNAMHYHPSSLELKLKLIEVEIEDKNGRYALDLIREIEGFAVSYKAEVCTFKARAMLLLQEVDRAIGLLDDLVKTHLNPRDIDLHAVINDLINSSKFAYAIRYLEFMCKQQDAYRHLLLDLAYCYERLNDEEGAIVAYNRYLDENPFSTLAWYELARLYEKNHNYSNASKAYDFVLTLDPTYSDAYYSKADTQAAEGGYEHAVKTLQDLLDEEPNNIRATYVMGEYYEKLGGLDDALRCYLSAIEYNDTFADAYYSAAFIFKEQGKLSDCITFLKKAVCLEPDNGEYHYGLGKVFMELGQSDDAINAFENALVNDKSDFESWLLLAELYALVDFAKSLSVLEDASAYVYDIPEISYRIAALYFLTSDMDKCVEHFERGVLLDTEKALSFFDICPAARHDERIMTIYINSKTKNSL